ncbi:hypothetical protein GY45DRAFT_139977 [Cubamyces sp. BRFM 1775]|nr:hypothetical protein GY45DRAFT_139977 [Cubamyces sp. BRFM 1775]
MRVQRGCNLNETAPSDGANGSPGCRAGARPRHARGSTSAREPCRSRARTHACCPSVSERWPLSIEDVTACVFASELAARLLVVLETHTPGAQRMLGRWKAWIEAREAAVNGQAVGGGRWLPPSPRNTDLNFTNPRLEVVHPLFAEAAQTSLRPPAW